ncbi:adenylyl-sulfate kinase [Niveibacterium umoris]|uniref:Adenylyl-sulfate kinase n=1 Tax=Niveibacterium umoris TaxID=1193620 RepID=A0A840BN44_9RHOO|nr:adenylylsulfate kinase [Niveibacterium umoris]
MSIHPTTHSPAPRTLWFTGLSGAGKSTLARTLERELQAAGHAAYVLDGDELRTGLCRDLGFSPADRAENIRRVAEVARIMNHAGLTVLVALVSPFERDRQNARSIIGEAAFREIHVSTPLGVCEARDPKSLYRKARAGQIPEFTGVSSPYEPPSSPELVLDTTSVSLDDAMKQLRELLA